MLRSLIRWICRKYAARITAQGDLNTAVKLWSMAIACGDTSPRAQRMLGELYFQLEDYARAMPLLESAAPHFAADDSLATMLARARQQTVKPESAEVHFNFGNTLYGAGRYAEAIARYRRALTVQPDHAQAHCNLGAALYELNRHEEAIASYRRALELKPDFVQVYANLGGVLATAKRYDEAVASYCRALELNPDLADARTSVIHVRQHLCDWAQISTDIAALREHVAQGKAGAPQPFFLLAMPKIEAREHFVCARQFAEEQYRAFLSRPPLSGADLRPEIPKMRIGYLSADFREHPVSYLLAQIIERHDRNRFEVYGYSCGPDDASPMRRRMQAAFDTFREIRPLSHEAAAQQILEDRIDILVDLNGHTENNRLPILALRPAPLQVSWLGYSGTLGHPRLADYLIGDPIVSPLEHADQFSETLALMPHCFQSNDRQRAIGARPTRVAAGLPAEGFVFCCFNQSYKITQVMFDLWCRLLSEVPGSVLWLLQPIDAAERNLKREAQARGIAAERIVFAPRRPLADHLGRLQLADLALDTDPYTSHTTASDALWAGVPLVTQLGKTFVSRAAASILYAAGLPELITQTPEAYYRTALELATQPSRLSQVKARLVANRLNCPLFDSERFTHDLEQLFRLMWEDYRAGNKRHIVIETTSDDGSEKFSLLAALPQQTPIPDTAEDHYKLGNRLKELGRHDDAVASYQRALALNPDYAEAHNNLGISLIELNRPEEAVTSYQRALAVKPDFADFHFNVGYALNRLDRREEAVASYRNALALKPDFADAYQNLGLILGDLKCDEDAVACHQRALELKPDFVEALSSWIFACQNMCAWQHLLRESEALRQRVTAGKSGRVPPFSFLALPATDPQEQYRCAQQFAEEQYRVFLSRPPLCAGALGAERAKIRIGYLSADFHDHPTSYLLAEVIERHDRSRFEVFGYSYGPDSVHPMRRRMQAAFDIFHEFSRMSHESAARRILDDGIDILVDLKGYTKFSRPPILALRPAPVQVNWLGYPGTMGHPRLADYLIGDAIVSPLEHAAHYSEVLALMPQCYQPNDRQRIPGARPARTDTGLPADGFVFCSFNQGYKITPAIFDIWCRLLAEVPGSLLWLLQPAAAAERNLRHEAQARGVAAERLVFAPMLPLAEHLGRLQLADLALDTYPVTSHTTASDALWAGVPLVTRLGETFASRVAASILHAAGLPKLITNAPEDYYRVALELATQPGRLAQIKARLEANRLSCPLFDSERFVRDLERLFQRMWEDYGAGIRQHIVIGS